MLSIPNNKSVGPVYSFSESRSADFTVEVATAYTVTAGVTITLPDANDITPGQGCYLIQSSGASTIQTLSKDGINFDSIDIDEGITFYLIVYHVFGRNEWFAGLPTDTFSPLGSGTVSTENTQLVEVIESVVTTNSNIHMLMDLPSVSRDNNVYVTDDENKDFASIQIIQAPSSLAKFTTYTRGDDPKFRVDGVLTNPSVAINPVNGYYSPEEETLYYINQGSISEVLITAAHHDQVKDLKFVDSYGINHNHGQNVQEIIFNSLVNLDVLWLDGSQLAVLPDGVSEMTNLTSLSLYATYLTDVPDLTQLENLERFFISNEDGVTLPSGYPTFHSNAYSNIKELWIYGASYVSEAFDNNKLSSLEVLYLSPGWNEGIVTQKFDGAFSSKLTDFDIYYSTIDNDTLDFSQSTLLYYFALWYCEFDGTTILLPPAWADGGSSIYIQYNTGDLTIEGLDDIVSESWVYINDNGFTTTAVDGYLQDLVNSNAINMDIDISGNSAPTDLVNVNVLISRGCSVAHD